MSTEVLEQKLVDLTFRVEKLEGSTRPAAKTTWRQAIGTSKGDDLDREAAQLGEEWRAAENRRD